MRIVDSGELGVVLGWMMLRLLRLGCSQKLDVVMGYP